MQPARMAVAHRPAQHGGAGQVHLARLQDDRLVERLMAVPVVLPDKDRSNVACFGICIGHLSAVDSGGGDMAEPYRDKAQHDRGDDIRRRAQPVAVPRQVQCLQAE